MILLGVDLEADGLDVNSAHILEYAFVMWSTTYQKPLRMWQGYLKSPIPVSNEITEITGIRDADIEQFGESPEKLLEVYEWIPRCDYIVAHNGLAYDKPLLESYVKRSLLPLLPSAKNLNWIDTMFDLPYPKSIKTRQLGHLAADHGFVNPFAHRALFDVLTMLKIQAQYPLEEIVKNAESPLVEVVAMVSFETKDEAKKRGFYWDSPRKLWVKKMKSNAVASLREQCPFNVEVRG